MTEMFSLLKEFTKGKSLEKVLVREEVKKPVTKYDNVIFLVKIRNDKDKGGDELVEKSISKPIELRENEEAIDDVMDNQSDRSVNKDSTSIGSLKFMNALADQGSYVNIMPLSIYDKLTSEKPIGTNIRLSLANHSYIDPLGIAEDVLVDVAGFVYLMDFVILDIKEDEHLPLILGIPFLTMVRAKIKFDKGSMTLKAGRYKIGFVRTLVP
ncbi:MAK10-like protein [Tanacetum coccineum]